MERAGDEECIFCSFLMHFAKSKFWVTTSVPQGSSEVSSSTPSSTDVQPQRQHVAQHEAYIKCCQKQMLAATKEGDASFTRNNGHQSTMGNA